jgi:hypothetical protein
MLIYKSIVILAVCGGLNWASVYFGHHVGIMAYAPGEGLPAIKFELEKYDQLFYDTYYSEEAVAFTFNMDADLTSLFNWNTNLVFASLVITYESGPKDGGMLNEITIWDKRMLRTNDKDYHLKLKNEWIEYYLTDVNKSLMGKTVDVFLRWE